MSYQSNRSFSIQLKQTCIYQVADSCLLLAKNVYNASLFSMLNLYSAYEYQKDMKKYTLKTELHSHQQEMIHFYKQAIRDFNQYQLNKYLAKKTAQPDLKKPTSIAHLENTMTSEDLHAILLQVSLLERVIKLKEKANPQYQDYGKVYSSIAQGALMQAVQDCKSWFQAMISFYSGRKSSENASLPQRPSYKQKNERMTVELSSRLFSKTGSLFKINPKKHTLFTDFHDKNNSMLPPSVIQEFNQLNLKQLIEDELTHKKRINDDVSYQIQTIRFVPQRVTHKGLHKHPVKIEVVVKVNSDLPTDSALSQAMQFYKANQAQYNPKLNQSFWDLKLKKQDKVLEDFIYSKPNQDFNISAIDLGVVNTATMIHQQASSHQIYSGSYINQQLTKLNQKLDKLKTDIFEKTVCLLKPDLLQTVLFNQAISQNKSLTPEEKSQQKIKLSRDDLKIIGQANRQVYQTKSYNNLLVKMENLKTNHLHQLSHHIIETCKVNKTDVLFIGKNEGWKQESEMNKTNNRLFLSLPHDKLIDLLTYKAQSCGMLVICTEESYTSQSSFLHGDDLPTYQVVSIKKEQSENQKTQSEFSGVRKDRRYTFKENKAVVFKGQSLIFIHADINGALNIPRKVFKSWSPSGLMSLNYEVIGHNAIPINRHQKKGRKKIKKKGPYFKVMSTHFLPARCKAGDALAVLNRGA